MSMQKNNMNKRADAPESRLDKGRETNSVPGINSPEISPPAFNPPVPNRAWTAMIAGKDIDELTPEEKNELYYGKDGL